MKQLFLDTNVVIDLLANRQPFATDVAILFDGIGRTCKIHISALSYNNIWYILRQSQKHDKTIALLKKLAAIAEISAVTKSTIQQALQSGFNDFEDAVQHFCALESGNIDALVTRNPKDFKQSIVAVMTPNEAISLINNVS